MNNAAIGILDSGIGGLSIWKEIVALLPRESTIYIADSQNAPYGQYSEEKIFALSKRLVLFLLDQKVKLIVIACNTITVSSLARLRQEFPQISIVGTVPAIKTAMAESQTKKIGLLVTERTAKSDYQRDLQRTFAKDAAVTTVGTNSLVPSLKEGIGKGWMML